MPGVGHVQVVVTRHSQHQSRDSFWSEIDARARLPKGTPPDAAEALLRRRLPYLLKQALVSTYEDSLEEIEKDLSREYEFLAHQRPHREHNDDKHYAEVLQKVIDFRHQAYATSAPLRRARDKRSIAKQIFFAVSDIRYSSLAFGLDIGPVSKLVELFERDFDALQVFLNAFVPQAFENTFGHEFSDLHQFDVRVSETVRRSFVTSDLSELHGDTRTGGAELAGSAVGSARAAWLWRLANGSLLIPVILGLLVMVYAVRELAAIQRARNEMMQPLLQHYMELLKEDRLRFRQERPPAPTSAPAPAPPVR
jgi:hypothetical protein